MVLLPCEQVDLDGVSDRARGLMDGVDPHNAGAQAPSTTLGYSTSQLWSCLAVGMSVLIHYREPTYRRAEAKPEPYRWSYRVAAATPNDGKRQALAEFRRVARLSGVGWIREVVRVEAQSVI